MDDRALWFTRELVAAGMDAADASWLASKRVASLVRTPDCDVRTLQAGVPGSVLLEWAQAGVPMAHAPEALEEGAILGDLLALSPAQVAELTPVAAMAARMGVALVDVAAALEVVRARPATVVYALALGFTGDDLAAAERVGVDFRARAADQQTALYAAPAGCMVDASAGSAARVLVLVLVEHRGVKVEPALAIAAGLDEVQADVAVRLVLDGQLLPVAVRAAVALTREESVTPEGPRLRVSRQSAVVGPEH